MRVKDFFSILGTSAMIGFGLSIGAYFIWTEAYKATSNSFWFSVAGIGLLCSPLAYLTLMKDTRCPKCSQPFSMSATHQTDIENFVIYKKEQVTENGHTRTKDVPYNARRYYQHERCDKCGHQSKYESRDEKRA